MASLSRSSDKAEIQPNKRPSEGLSDTDGESHSETESEYEEGRSRSRRHQNGATSIGDRLVKRRRADRSDAPPRSMTPPSRSPPEESSEAEGDVSEEESQHSASTTPSSSASLKWENIPYPGLPVSRILPDDSCNCNLKSMVRF